MSWRDTLQKLSHGQVREIAALCSGAAILIVVALVLSGSVPFLPQSVTTALQQDASSQSAAVWWSQLPCPNGTCSGYPSPHSAIKNQNDGTSDSYKCDNGTNNTTPLTYTNTRIGVLGASVPDGTSKQAAYVNYSSTPGSTGTMVVRGGSSVVLDYACQDTQTVAYYSKHGCGTLDSTCGCYYDSSAKYTFADTATLSGPGAPAGTLPLIGSVTIPNVVTNTSYTLTCKKPSSGQSWTTTLPINILNLSISAAPQSVYSGASSTVSWASAWADPNSCSVTGPSGTIVQAPPIPFAQTSLPGAVGGYNLNPVFSSNGSKIAVTDGTNYLWTSTDGGVTWSHDTTSPKSISGIGSSGAGDLAVSVQAGDIWKKSASGGSWTDISSGPAAGAKQWFHLAYSQDGTKIAATVNGGYIYIYNGTSWTQSASSQYWRRMDISADGNVLVAGVASGDLWASTNGGVTWTDIGSGTPGAKNWTSIALSADGKKVVATAYGAGVWVGTYNSGRGTWSWTDGTTASLGAKNWISSALSSDGTHFIAAAYQQNIYTSSNGTTWTPIATALGTPKWYSVGITPDGTRVFAGVLGAGGLFYGQYPGATAWVAQATFGARNLTAITSSADGTKLAAGVSGGDILTSADSGTTWTDRTTSGARAWTSITSSADGTKIAATVNNGYIWTSINSGVDWKQTTSGARIWTAITSSQDGIKLAATALNGDIWTSANSGLTWNDRTTSGARAWTTITSSADGSHLVAAGTNSAIYVSNDSGATWNPYNTATMQWHSVVSSADGTKIAAEGSWQTTDYLYTSTNGGVTWTQQSTAPPLNTLYSLASSADGTKLVSAGTFNSPTGYLYISSNGGVSWIQQTGAGVHAWFSVISSADGSKLAATFTTFSGNNIYTYKNDYGNISGTYNATNITSPQRYTISCTLNGSPISVSTDITLTGGSPPIVTITGNGQSGAVTVPSGTPVNIVATFNPVGSYTGSAINDFQNNALTSQDASSPKTYIFNTPSNPAAPGSYVFNAAIQTSALGWANSFGKSLMVTVAGVCPANCPGPSAPNCTANSGFTYNSSNNTCPAKPACVPAWLCTSWSTCSSGGTQTCTGAVDTNSCGVATGNPVGSTQSCTPPPPTITTFSASPTRVHKNTPTNITFTWSGANLPAGGCSVSGTAISGKASPQTASITIAQPTIFTLTCGSAQKSVTMGLIPTVIEL